MRIYTVSDAAQRFGVRREDITLVAGQFEIGRKIGTTFVFTRDDLEDLEDALIGEGLIEADPDDGPDEDEEPGDDEDGGDEE